MFESIAYTETSHGREDRRLLDKHLREKHNEAVRRAREDPEHNALPPRSRIRQGKQLLVSSFELWHSSDSEGDTDLQEIPVVTSAEEEKLETMVSAVVRAQVQVLETGVEFLPKHQVGSRRIFRDECDKRTHLVKGHFRHHVRMVFELMHVNILKDRWTIVNRCFAMLVSIPHMDIRDIWPIGLRLLKKRNERKFLQTFVTVMEDHSFVTAEDVRRQGAESFFTKQQLSILSRLRNPEFAKEVYRSEKAPLAVVEETVRLCIKSGNGDIAEYLNWMSRSYNAGDGEPFAMYPHELMNETPNVDSGSLRKRIPLHNRHAAPPYRAGTKNSPNPYTGILMWELLISGDLRRCKEMTSQLVLEYPYSSHGLYYYVRGMAYFLELQLFVSNLKRSRISDVENIKIKVNELKDTIRDCLERSSKLGFEYPKGSLIREMISIDRFIETMRLARYENNNNQSNYESEYSDSNAGYEVDSSDYE